MIYILIVLWMGNSSSYSGKAAIAVEFNDMKSCQAAESALRKQVPDYQKIVTQCAAKGNKQ